MKLDDLSKKYHDGTIPEKGKGELCSLFLAQFGFTSKQSFFDIIRKTRVPTPLEWAWLEVKFEEYYKYYQDVQKLMEQEAEVMALHGTLEPVEAD